VVHLDIDRPTRGLDVELRYDPEQVGQMRILDFASIGEGGRLTQVPDAPTLRYRYDGWLFPRAGMVFVWTLPDEQWWPIARQLGLRLQRARIAKGLSQEALAHAAGISTYTYQKFEKGESRPGTPMNPRLCTLIALATVLDMQVEELMEGMWHE
jgi:hypothetical protein avisC_04866